MILDLDTGVDDALAIAYALAVGSWSNQIESSYGNNPIRCLCETALSWWNSLGHALIFRVFKGLPRFMHY